MFYILFIFVSFRIAPIYEDYSLYSGEKTTLFSCDKTKIVVIYRNECEKIKVISCRRDVYYSRTSPPPTPPQDRIVISELTNENKRFCRQVKHRHFATTKRNNETQFNRHIFSLYIIQFETLPPYCSSSVVCHICSNEIKVGYSYFWSAFAVILCLGSLGN